MPRDLLTKHNINLLIFARIFRSRRAALLTAFVMICLAPWLPRLARPSIYADDIERIGKARSVPFGELIVAPYNEHLAPLFQLDTWIAWNATFGVLNRAPATFTFASYVPFVLVAVLLGAALRREIESLSGALLGVALFCFSTVYVESVYWYSASSFTWALFFSVLAFDSAARSDREGVSPNRSRSALVVSAIASALAPACSAIGVVAGPFAAIRLIGGRERPLGINRIVSASIPIAGTAIYLAFAATVRHHHQIYTSLNDNWNGAFAVRCLVRGVAGILIPNLIVGANFYEYRISEFAAVIVFLVFPAISFLIARRYRAWGVVFGGLWLIAAGYATTFGLRSRYESHWALHELTRYHLFPHAGLIFVLAPVLGGLGRRLDRRPDRGLAVVVAIAAILCATRFSAIRKEANKYRFDDQIAALNAIDRLDRARLSAGVRRDDLTRLFDPMRTRWAPYPCGGHALSIVSGDDSLIRSNEAGRARSNNTDRGGRSKLTDSLIRLHLLSRLTAEDRGLIFAGIDVTPYLEVVREESGTIVGGGRMTNAIGVRRDLNAKDYISKGYPAFLEFEIEPTGAAGAPRLLAIPAGIGSVDRVWEVWWTTRDGAWTQSRSVTLKADSHGETRSLGIPLDRVPHWDCNFVSEMKRDRLKIRVVTRSGGKIAGEPARLIR